jgi:hypothetical protein
MTDKDGNLKLPETRTALAVFWSTFAAAYVTAITFHAIPKDNVRFADTVLGFLLGTLISTLINWYFGSSKSANDKETPNETA